MTMSFVRKDRPTIVGMLRSTTADLLVAEIDRMLQQGVDAFGFQHEIVQADERNEENYKKIFSAMQGKPAYITNYVRCNVLDLTDEQLTEELFLLVKLGAKLVDLRCDLFDRQPDEYSTDPVAIEKQKKLIDQLHAMGVEVLMSAHVLKYTPYERVLEIALAQQARGVDVVKIVTEANSEQELAENFKISLALQEQIKMPVLFLCNGTHCRKHRIFAPLLDNGLYLAGEYGGPGVNQPTIQEAKEQLQLAGYNDLP